MPTKGPERVSADMINHDPPSDVEVSVDLARLGPAETSGLHIPARRPKRSATFTSTPETAPPHLLCPGCDRPLVYRQTVISGVKPIEQWHHFECRACGPFVYRARTRKLRRSA